MGTLLEWGTLLPALDSAQESSESCLMFFISRAIVLPSCFVKFNSNNNHLILGVTSNETERVVVGCKEYSLRSQIDAIYQPMKADLAQFVS